MKDVAPQIFAKCATLVSLLTLSPTASSVALHEPRPRNPVLLIHGLADSEKSMELMKLRLKKAAWNAVSVSLVPSDGSAPLEQLAAQLANYIQIRFSPQQKIDIVAFSMGGVVARYYLQKLGGAARVERFVCISAPNHGSLLAYLSTKPGCRQMRPGSEFLTVLNRDFTGMQTVRCLSIWTPLDLTIIPASSSRLETGISMRTWAVAHPLMILQRGCFENIARFLDDSATATPKNP